MPFTAIAAQAVAVSRRPVASPAPGPPARRVHSEPTAPVGDASSDELPVRLTQRLVQLDSSNPPGNERACVELIAATLQEAGVVPRVLARDPERPNLVARIPGRG